jgi:hypothetical protein
VETVFASIVTDRGGLSNFDQTALHVARRVAQMLADDSDLSASALSALMALLPAKSAAGDSYDLSRLSDEEFAVLDRLTAKAADVALPPAPVPEVQLRLQSPRQREAERLAIMLDELEACAEAQRKVDWRRPWTATDEDVQAVRGAITSLIGLAPVTERQIAEPWIDEAVLKERRTWLDKEEQAKAVERVHDVIDQPQREAAPEPPRGNVQPLFGAFVTKRPRGSGPPWSDAGSVY